MGASKEMAIDVRATDAMEDSASASFIKHNKLIDMEQSDNRAWLSEAQYHKALSRINFGEIDLYDKIDKTFRVKQSYRDILLEATEFSKSMKRDAPTTSDLLICELKPLQLTKAAIEGTTETLVTLVRSGDLNALDVVTRLQYISDVCDQVRKALRDDCVVEVERHGKKAVINGADVTKAETGVTYDFSQSNDPLWNEASEQEKQWKEKKKDRETMLKTIKGSMDVIIEGEPLTLNQPVKSGTTSIKISFPK